jgi:hypothetical protein
MSRSNKAWWLLVSCHAKQVYALELAFSVCIVCIVIVCVGSVGTPRETYGRRRRGRFRQLNLLQ